MNSKKYTQLFGKNSSIICYNIASSFYLTYILLFSYILLQINLVLIPYGTLYFLPLNSKCKMVPLAIQGVGNEF